MSACAVTYFCATGRQGEGGGSSVLRKKLAQLSLYDSSRAQTAENQNPTGRVNRWDTHLTLKPLLMPVQRELRFALLRVHWLPWLLNA